MARQVAKRNNYWSFHVTKADSLLEKKNKEKQENITALKPLCLVLL